MKSSRGQAAARRPPSLRTLGVISHVESFKNDERNTSTLSTFTFNTSSAFP